MTTFDELSLWNTDARELKFTPWDWELQFKTYWLIEKFEAAVETLCNSNWAKHYKTGWNFIEAVDNNRCKWHCTNPDSFAICWRKENCNNFVVANKVSSRVSKHYDEKNLEEATSYIY